VNASSVLCVMIGLCICCSHLISWSTNQLKQ